MMGNRFLVIAITTYRNFSTKTGTKTKKWFGNRYRKKAIEKELVEGRTSIKWTDQQKQVISAVSMGRSVFITGSAGTGKTALIEHLIKTLGQKRYEPSNVFVTAATGVAACAISGQTLHSFSGIKHMKADRELLLQSVLSNKQACRRWKKAKALVIDEISMVSAKMFEDLEYIARVIRDVDEVWGGIQLVVGGDFFQLPPIIRPPDPLGKEFAFEADCWNSSFDLQVEQTQIFRQSDLQLIKILQGIRRGEIDPSDLECLEEVCCSKTKPDDSVVQLFPRIEDVATVNEERMEKLNNEIVVYTAVDSGIDKWKRQLDKGIAPDEIGLCEKARVMLIKNVKTWRGLVNGATGTILGFVEPEERDVTDICKDGLLPLVKFDSGQTMVVEPETWEVREGDVVRASRKQIPLILAWSLSIHKCQGMTLDRLHTDLSRAFGYGMVYVALSRVRSFEGLHLSGFDSSKVQAHPKVLKFYKNFVSEQYKEIEDDCSGKAHHISRGNT
ncbi:ATP-dependent DNA helicase PIF1 [Ziziphus jujuba]|uniref:ATP-dependent DNA helicase n=1 Tax=Ziziphus jujuba TaxID=326968 RepID=A0A6P6FTN0_ZIZJJ|nr:ATP-dependent DNA helicase PIF1 [Ziziphus jujuba]XP_024924920.3 ATP-dependent DNA helicase PIF1 [Ziziphus jujuba]